MSSRTLLLGAAAVMLACLWVSVRLMPSQRLRSAFSIRNAGQATALPATHVTRRSTIPPMNMRGE
jgi:hypothetical protein